MKAKARSLLLLAYILANTLAAVRFYRTGILGGDFIGFSAHAKSILILAFFATIVSLLMLSRFVRVLDTIGLGIGIVKRYRLDIGGIIIALQLGYLVFNYANGTNIAGSIIRSSNPISLFFVVVNPDYIFICYLLLSAGFDYKKKINIIIYIGSNIMRGWMGFWIIIIFFFLGKIREIFQKKRLVVLYSVIILVLVPFSYSMKWIVRGTDSYDFQALALAMDPKNGQITDLIDPIVMRFQQIANNYEYISNKKSLRMVFSESRSYSKENILSYIMDKVFKRPKDRSFSVAIFNHYRGKGDTAYQIGILGYLYLIGFPENMLFIAYILFTILLFYAGLQLIKAGNKTERAKDNDLLWFGTIVYLGHGWFLAFSYLTIALYLYLAIVALKTTIKKYSPLALIAIESPK